MASNQKWPPLDDFIMLLVNNNRSKAYLQNLIKNNHIPAKVLLLDSGNMVLPEHTDHDLNIHAGTSQQFIRYSPESGIEFDEKEHIHFTVRQHNIPFTLLSTLDVNSKVVIDEIKNSPSDYIVYSGPGGTILRSEILSAGKSFLHVHPGWLPDYRGSTTIYYSMLAGDDVGCSVIIMIEKVDEGPVFYRHRFTPDKETDLDYVLDPAVRTATLVDFFNQNRGKSLIPITLRTDKENEIFFIIHPLLKHLAILSLKDEQ